MHRRLSLGIASAALYKEPISTDKALYVNVRLEMARSTLGISLSLAFNLRIFGLKLKRHPCCSKGAHDDELLTHTLIW